MSLARLYILLMVSCIPSWVQAQHSTKPVVDSLGYDELIDLPLNSRGINIGDSIFFLAGSCKNSAIIKFHNGPNVGLQARATVPLQKTVPLLTVHGNILYNFSYRNYIDTPFAQQDLMQHLVQTNLSILIKEKYPVKMTITNRSSNSPYFKNATDVNVEFNQRQLLNNIKNELRNKATQLVHADGLSGLEQAYKTKLGQERQLQSWINSPARAQELVEEKEKQLRGNLPRTSAAGIKGNAGKEFKDDDFGDVAKGGIQNFLGVILNKKKYAVDSVKKDLTDSGTTMLDSKEQKIKDSSMLDKINAKKLELQKLQATLKQDEANVRQEQKKVQDSIARIKQEINGLKTNEGLYAFMKRHGISKDSLTKAQRLLLSVRKVGIGRNWIDYSELTVKNVSLTGVNIEVTPSTYYVAFAAGRLNYRFRDFILKDNKTLPNQSLYLVRAGLGQPTKNNLIFTFYNGKKEVLNNTASTDPSSIQKVLGISAESRLAIDENNYIVAEYAKSSYGNNTNTAPTQPQLLQKAFNWKVRTNEAYSIKLFSQYPQTNTRISAFYRKTGEDFQSFNLYPIGSNQEAWMAKVNQSFWKRKLTFDAAIRKNDFVSPIAAPSFNSKTIFKSLQATLQIPKYPFISVGYYPSSQLSLSNNNVLTESQYNTLNVIVSKNYLFKKVAMNTNAVYTKFYNSSSDSGFIYYNASSYTITHSIFISPFTLQSSIGVTDQKDFHLFTLEQTVGYQFKNKMTLSGGTKWNRLNDEQNLFGGTASLGIYIKKLGTLQFNYDKTYLPGYTGTLRPVDIGRMSFYRDW